MTALLPNVDPDGLLEYSVVYTDRALNHMSQAFQADMRYINQTLKSVYNAEQIAIVPGSGTFGMEAVARQFATGKKTLVIRNGFFSFRWTQILEVGNIASSSTVLMARQGQVGDTEPFAPAPINDVLNTIAREKPEVVFAPHVETSSGIILPDGYIQAMAEAVHAVGGLLVLDCIASGCLWVDMQQLGVDVLVSAPQKGWSGSPFGGLIMLGERGAAMLENTTSTSFAADLKKWRDIMMAYVNGGHAYHATMPTDAIAQFAEVMRETEEYGFAKVKQEQQDLGDAVRTMLAGRGIKSVAATGFGAPGVVVSYTSDDGIHNGSKFVAEGMQIAAGVPLVCNEPAGYKTFRLGLFGLDKLHNIERSVASLEAALDKVL
ncbi:MAG: alanine--glyoxylate aminotransferase family protein [Gammaproteobacteria bacterium]|nr:alanine--glyoxylate aminotransferase family protein [Gammaproteobacteria bacterium]